MRSTGESALSEKLWPRIVATSSSPPLLLARKDEAKADHYRKSSLTMPSSSRAETNPGNDGMATTTMKTISLLILSIALAVAVRVEGAESRLLRLGHFPNITHAQALVAHNLSRQGKGWFEERIGPGTKVEWFVYNAGPSAMEAIFAQSIDLTYVGPGPALNAYTRSNGSEIRLIAGAANGGAALVVQSDQDLKTPADFRGKKVATPQLGNTQDISCRAWLTAGGLKITQLGGDAQVLPTQNPDQLVLFQQKKIDAVWTVEPWVSRLVGESRGKILVDEKDVATTVLVSSVKFLAQQRDLVRKVAQAHAELTEWMTKNPEEAQKLARAELLEETKGDMASDLIAQSWKRIAFTAEVPSLSVESFVQNSMKSGFIKSAPDLSKLFEKP
jgi:NitT/TauT family transport system substrate-binding protein